MPKVDSMFPVTFGSDHNEPSKIPSRKSRRRLRRGLGYLSEPPNVDLLEVEFVTEKKIKMRENMIDKYTNQETLETPVMSKDERYVEFVNMTYSYTNIEDTTFSVAIAQPSFGLYEFNYTTGSSTVGFDEGLGHFIGEDSMNDFILIAPWEFCTGIQEGNATTDQIADKLQEVIANNKDLKDTVLATCDTYMVTKLFIDAQITKELLKKWEEAWDEVSQQGVIYQLVATQGGLTRIHPASVPETWSEEEVRGIQDPWEQAYYQRALYTDNYVFAVPYNRAGGKKLGVNETFMANITASKALRMMGDKQITAAVLAVTFDPKAFNDMWIDKTIRGFNTKKSGISCKDGSLLCYILDDGGFIVATNQENQQKNVGMFFGEVDGDIMYDTHNKTFFDKRETIDYQAACPRQSIAGDAAPRINIPTIWDILNFQYWAFTAAWTFIRHTLYDMFIFGMTDYSMIGAEKVTIPDNVSCIKLQKQYHFNQVSLQAGEGFVQCLNCTRSWASSRIAGTNLMLLVTTMGDDCTECPDRKLTQEAEEPPPEKVPNPCFIKPYYRRRPQEAEYCYRFHPNESEICSGSSIIHPSMPVLAIHFIFTLVAVILVKYDD